MHQVICINMSKFNRLIIRFYFTLSEKQMHLHFRFTHFYIQFRIAKVFDYRFLMVLMFPLFDVLHKISQIFKNDCLCMAEVFYLIYNQD